MSFEVKKKEIRGHRGSCYLKTKATTNSHPNFEATFETEVFLGSDEIKLGSTIKFNHGK